MLPRIPNWSPLGIMGDRDRVEACIVFVRLSLLLSYYIAITVTTMFIVTSLAGSFSMQLACSINQRVRVQDCASRPTIDGNNSKI